MLDIDNLYILTSLILNMIARNCHECSDYIPSRSPSWGLCGRVEELAYQVSAKSEKCIYSSPGERLTQLQVSARNDAQKKAIAKFDEHLKRASERVSRWSKWKRDLLGA